MIVEKPCGCKVETTNDAEGVLSIQLCKTHPANTDELQPFLTNRGFTLY